MSRSFEVPRKLLSGLKSVEGQPTFSNLADAYPPTRAVMYCQRYQTTHLYCLLPGQPQVNRAVFGRQLFVSLSAGSFLARRSDYSSPLNMTLTRTVVDNMQSWS